MTTNILYQTLHDRQILVENSLAYIKKTHEIFEKYASSELKATHNRFEPLIEGLQSDKVRLVVIGEFSRGKSRLVNAILGIDLLPSAKEATTAINTFLQSPPHDRADEKFIQLEFIDPERPLQELSWSDGDDTVIKQWGTELDKNNKSARGELRNINVFASHQLLDKGLVIIDTPGLESVVAHHEEITRNAIAKSHIAIWVLSADQLGGNNREWKFLKETVRQHFRKFLTVVNMWDMVLDPEDNHDKIKPEAQREAEKLDIVKENFRKYLDDLSESELIQITDDQHLMGVSAKWGLSDQEELRKRSGVNRLIQRIADLCNSDEARREIFYTPLKQLSAIQKILNEALDDEILALNDIRDIKEQKMALDLLEHEIRNQELEQNQTANEYKEEHHRVAKNINQRINDELVYPLRELKDEVEIYLTVDFIKREVEAGHKDISLPVDIDNKYKQVMRAVGEAWTLQKQQLVIALTELKSEYIEALKQHTQSLQDVLGEINMDIPEIKIDLHIDLSGIIDFQNRKRELECQLEESEQEISKFELGAAHCSIDDPSLRQAREAYERAQRNLTELGVQPTPIAYTDSEKITNGGLWQDPKYRTYTRYDDSNVRAYEQQRNEYKSDISNREKEIERLTQEEIERSKQRQTYEISKLKAEQRYAKLERERQKYEQELASEKENLIENTLKELKNNTIGELNHVIKYLENNASQIVNKLFEDQLAALLSCVEEQFMQPLRAKQAKREEILKLFEQGKEEIERRKSELACAKKELEEVIEFTTRALDKA